MRLVKDTASDVKDVVRDTRRSEGESTLYRDCVADSIEIGAESNSFQESLNQFTDYTRHTSIVLRKASTNTSPVDVLSHMSTEPTLEPAMSKFWIVTRFHHAETTKENTDLFLLTAEPYNTLLKVTKSAELPGWVDLEELAFWEVSLRFPVCLRWPHNISSLDDHSSSLPSLQHHRV